jgi:prepilin-type N-terminal cleavage/methylation domain-containing protein
MAPPLLKEERTMTNDFRSTRRAGFTLIEMLIVLALMAIVMGFGLPGLFNMISRSKLEGAARQTAAMIRLARLESIKANVSTVVKLKPDASGQNVKITVFADVNDAGGNPLSDLIYNPKATGDFRATDHVVSSVTLPSKVFLLGETGQKFAGFTVNPDSADSGGPNIAVFDPSGALRVRGSYYLSDAKGNFLCVRVQPEATARVTILKYNASVTGAADKYYEPGNEPTTGKPLWDWK